MRIRLYSLLFLPCLLTITGCEEPVILETTGTLSGKVTEAGTRTPLENALVSITGKSFTTGADGAYTFTDLPEGDYTVEVSMPGYTSEKKQYSVKAGKETIADFTLYPEYAEVEVSTSSLDFGTTLDKLTFEISKPDRSARIEWYIEKQSDANWLSFSETSGTMTTSKTSITVYLLRSELTEDKVYTTSLIVKVKNGGSATIQVSAQRKSAQLAADPTSLDFGTAETEKTILLSNATQEGVLNYKASPTESWISVENPEGTISNTGVAVLKVMVNRVNLAAAAYTGTLVISSNRNTLTIPVNMQVLGKQRPEVGSLQSVEIKHSSFNVSAFISSIGSAAVTALGFCWSSSNTQPTTADNKNNLGGTTVPKSFSATITGVLPNTLYYVRAYAQNEEGVAYSEVLQVQTLPTPTYPVVRTLETISVGHDSATLKGSVDDLGDGYVTSYGFCYSTENPNPTLAGPNMSLGSTATKGEFEGTVSGLNPKTHYFVRAFATNSVGTAYGGTVEITTTGMPPVVTSGLLAYYNFDEKNCDDYLGEVNYHGVIQGSGNEIAFVDDTPLAEGYALKGSNGGQYYRLLVAPDYNQATVTYSVWLKTKATTCPNVYEQAYSSTYARGIWFNEGKLRIAYYSGSWNYYNVGLETLLFDGKWHHLVVIWKSGANSFYIDGRFIASWDKKWTYSDIYKGKVSYLGELDGLMDNLRIYNRALSEGEIKEIFSAKQ